MVVRMPQGAGPPARPDPLALVEALFLHVPGMLRRRAVHAADAKGLLKSAIRDDNPVVFIEHEYLYGQRGEVPDDEDHTVDFGQAAIRREGDDVTIIGISRWRSRPRRRRSPARRARDRGRGDRPAHAAPLDLDTILESVRKTNRA
jgi:pyruvate dehydrogenase E1 component beta subunit